MNLRRGCCW